MPLSLSDQKIDPVGARETLRGLLALRSALELVGGGARLLPSSSQAASSTGEQPSSSFCRESERALFTEVQDLERRTGEAASRAEHPSAKRAVALLARRDLLDLSLEGAADLFEESAEKEKEEEGGSGGTEPAAAAAAAALYLRALRPRASSLLDEWRLLLEDCELEAENELAAAEARARAAEARAGAAEARLRELTKTTTAAAPRRPLPDAIAAITLVSSSSPTELKKLEIGRKPEEKPEAAKKKEPSSNSSNTNNNNSRVARAPPASRLPPTEAEARALLKAERDAEGGEGEAFRMPPASEVETPVSAVVAAAAAAAREGNSVKVAPQPRQPPLQRSSSSAASLLLLGLPDSGGNSFPAAPGSPSLSLRALASVLDDIFACKSRADDRARQAGVTRPSLSHFLDSYLLARFGGAAFGAVAREWRSAIEGASAAAHAALCSEGDGGDASSSSSAALVEAAAFQLILQNKIDEEWWLEAARLREALAAELGGGLRSAADGVSGAGTPAAATSAPSSPSARRGGGSGGGVAAAAVAAAFDSNASAAALPSLLPAVVERAAWERALAAALPTRALASAAARLIEDSSSRSNSSSTAVPRSLVLSCALRASLRQRVHRLAPAAAAFAAAAAAEAGELPGRRSQRGDASSLRPRAFRRFCAALAPGMRARDVAALLDALVPSSSIESDGAAVAWSTAASALASELEREELEGESE